MKHLKLFVALFAMLALGVTNAWGAEEVTLSITSSITSNGTLTDGGGGSWSLTSDGSYTSNNAYIQVGTNKLEVTYLKLSTSSYSSKKIEKIQVWGTSKANTNVTIKVYIGNNKLGESDAFTSQNASTGGTEFAVENTNNYTGDILIEISRPTSTTGAIYFNKAVITYHEDGETPDVIVKTLKSIAVEGMTTNYETGDIFKFDGTCTATYSVTQNDVPQEDETKVVTPTSVSTPDMSTVGEKEVTVTYTEDEVTVTATYTINVTENVITAGTYDIVPNNAFWGTSFTGSNANTTETLSGKQDDISILHTRKGSNLYVNDSQTRVYANHYMQISVPAGYVITAIAFTADGENWAGTHTADVGTMTDSKNWTGSANAIKITFGGTCRITKITVTYAEAGETPEDPVVPEGPKNLGAKTIAEFLALKNTTDTCVLTGVVANIANTTFGNFDLVDATGSVYVYGLLTATGESKQFESMNIAAGDTLTVKAIYNEYNSKAQAKNAIYVSHTKTATPVVPENLGAKTIAEFLELKNTTDTCVLTGVVANITNTTFGNFDLVDATGTVYVYGLLTAAGESRQFESMDIAAGDTLTVKAIYNEHNSTPQAKNAIYVSHSKLVLTVAVTSENGTVDGLADGGKYVRGQEATLTATPAEGYEFVNWTKGEEVVSTKNPYTFTVTADVALVANFKLAGPATALDNIAVEGKAVKAIINGQLIIIKNGVQYNAQGQVIK